MSEYYNDAGEAGTEVVSSRPMSIVPLESFAIGQPTRAMRRIAHRAQTQAVQEKFKARLASEIVVNTVALTALADQAAISVPNSEPVCREVIRIYALSSAERLGRMW